MSKPRAACRRTASSAISRRLVGRVVEDLDLEQVARVVDLADRIDQAVGDVHLVVNRQLDGDARQRRPAPAAAAAFGAFPVFHVKIHKVIAVPPVDGQDAEDEEIQDENECLRQRRHKEMNPSRGHNR